MRHHQNNVSGFFFFLNLRQDLSFLSKLVLNLWPSCLSLLSIWDCSWALTLPGFVSLLIRNPFRNGFGEKAGRPFLCSASWGTASLSTFQWGSRNPKYKSNPIRRKHHLSWVHGEPDPFDHCEGSGQFLWSGWEIYRYSSSHERMYVWQTQSCSAPEKYTFPEAFWGNGNPDNIEKSSKQQLPSLLLLFHSTDPKTAS